MRVTLGSSRPRRTGSSWCDPCSATRSSAPSNAQRTVHTSRWARPRGPKVSGTITSPARSPSRWSRVTRCEQLLVYIAEAPGSSHGIRLRPLQRPVAGSRTE